MKVHSQSRRALLALERLIEHKELIIWARSADGTSHMIDAVSVCLNGIAVQIELDPKYRIVER